MFELLALDIDDTLTDQPSEISSENLAAIRDAQSAGIFVTVATGRGYLASSSVWEKLNVKGPVINYGGAIVMDTRTDGLLYATEVGNELVHEALSFAGELNVHAQLYQGDNIVCGRDCEHVRRYVGRLGLPLVIEPDIGSITWKNVPKVLYITDPDNAQRILPAVEERFMGRLKVSKSQAGFIELNHIDANKGTGLIWVAKSLGIPMQKVAAMGDNTLDIEMIRSAGLGVAVGNAAPEIKAAADMVAPDCRDNAVAWLIREVLLK